MSDNTSSETNSDSDKFDTMKFPNGGFPPIYICNDKTKKVLNSESDETINNTKREYTTHKSTVSIKSILEKRRVIPFMKI